VAIEERVLAYFVRDPGLEAPGRRVLTGAERAALKAFWLVEVTRYPEKF